MPAEGLEEKEISTKGAVIGKKWSGVGVREWTPPPPPTLTVHSNSKSNMAGRINDHELAALARPNKTPELQASLSSALYVCLDWLKTKSVTSRLIANFRARNS